MAYERHYLAGWTDYTGVSLEDIVRHLGDWANSTRDTIDRLKGYRRRTTESAALLENPIEVLGYLDFFIDLFGRYLADIERLLIEIPSGVTEAHLQIVDQIYRSVKREDDGTVQFKNDWVYKTLPHEEMRPLLDNIYGETRNMLVDYRDLSNLVPRLKTFVGAHPQQSEFLPDVQLKPGLFGIGVNLNRLIPKVHRWWKGRK